MTPDVRIRCLAGLLPMLLFILAVPAPAQTVEEEGGAVIAAAQRLFGALAAKDEAMVMAAVIPDGRVTGHAIRDGRVEVLSGSWAEWAGSLSAVSSRLEERMYSPEVRLRGSLASIWTEYDFFVDGNRAHCGVNLFDLAKVAGQWRVLNVSYTRETDGCPAR